VGSAHARALAEIHSAHGPHLYQQQRGLKWAFWREDPPIITPPESPPIDSDLIDQIVAIAGPQAMDVATWAMIAEGSYPFAGVGQLVLRGMHEGLGLPWMGVIPLTVVLVRTGLLPIYLHAQKSSTGLLKCQKEMQHAKQKLESSMLNGGNAKEAQVWSGAVCFCILLASAGCAHAIPLCC
jgi:hypothetical protein